MSSGKSGGEIFIFQRTAPQWQWKSYLAQMPDSGGHGKSGGVSEEVRGLLSLLMVGFSIGDVEMNDLDVLEVLSAVYIYAGEKPQLLCCAAQSQLEV